MLTVVPSTPSHRQGILRSPLCRRLPFQGRQGQAQARHPRRPGHDHPHNYANAATRGRPARLQHVFGRSRSSQFCWYWRSQRPNQRAARGHRAPSQEPRAFPPCRHQAAKRCPVVRPARNGQDPAGSCRGKQLGDQLFERYEAVVASFSPSATEPH